jgi:hypothetical protein
VQAPRSRVGHCGTWERRSTIGASLRGGEKSPHGQVVNVMSGGLAQRTSLAEAGRRAVDEPRVLRRERVVSDAQPVGDPGPEALDEDIGILDKGVQSSSPGFSFEIQRSALHRSLTAVGIVRRRDHQRIV